MYEEDMVGFHLFFANVVIDCFSLFLNFSTYNLIKETSPSRFPGIREIGVECLKEERRVSQYIHFYFCSFQGIGKILKHRPKKVLNFEKSSLYMQRSRYYTQSHLLNKISSRRLAIILLLISSLGHTTLGIFEPGV